MNLSLKSIRFILEALDHYERDHDRRLADNTLSEDEISDLTNDRQLLVAIKKDFETYRDHLIQDRQHVSAEA
ncbi:MAG: hypothetical protein HYX68_06860 [Planctomycetes bacterium]|nr:hypothetical protein [Planctomycetota bacterium]